MTAPRRAPRRFGGPNSNKGRPYFSRPVPTDDKTRALLAEGSVPDVDSDCILWTGKLSSEGYGVITGYHHPAHKVAYVLEHGEQIPHDSCVVNTCGTKLCVNTDHLKLATRREVLANGTTPAAETIRSFEQGHCKFGHDITQPGALYVSGKNRRCAQCAREYFKQWRAGRKKAQGDDT